VGNGGATYSYATGAVSVTDSGSGNYVYAGGITGWGGSTNSVALNSGITASSSGTVYAGRVTGRDAGTNNYALDGLEPELTGTQQTNTQTNATTDNANNAGGGAITTATLTESWFKDTSKWKDSAAWAFGSTEAAPWKMGTITVNGASVAGPVLWFE
jgi:hypothetical protein